ncbi:organic hydroperoxide resistance protein [Achromobacter deleyi]|uniref:organic hydroperoxide resistance protein n=1 Tax=Achromobacter deleyi TaxID=1353891 RepID=UPI0014913868|nr:organic hydroperoxide resistance protein [Achromobacter deleyi]QVQ26170.1 organic hydroperoxide resistance protein [Achromobacter deleyi]UIP21732.1 organic hydroperoxide resistance protein [Achromobacter deleyi]
MAKQLEQVLYTAHTHTTSGRDGAGRSSDGALDVTLSPPGSGKPGTNPEQLFGVGYSACFMGAMKRAGNTHGIAVPADVAIDASVSLGKVDGGANFALGVTLAVSLPGLNAEQKQFLVETAHQICPYSRAIRDNIDVRFELA